MTTENPEAVNEALKTAKPETTYCERCKIDVPNSLIDRHMQIHNVAARFTSNELLASLVLTQTEIKVILQKMMEMQAYDLAVRRSR